MRTQLATLVYAGIVIAFFALDRDRNARTSKALWIPVVWLAIVASRAVSQWLASFGLASVPTSADSIAAPDLYIEGSSLDRNIYMVLSLLGLIVLVKRGPQVGRLLRANVPIVLFCLYCGASALWSDYGDITFKRWIKGVGDIVMVLVVVTDPDRRSAIKRWLKRVGFLLIPFSVLLIKYYPGIGRVYNRWTWEMMVTGVSTHKNLLGRLCLVFGIVFLWSFLAAWRDRPSARRTRQLIVQGSLLTMLMWLFIKANSMTSLGCFLLAGAFLVAAGSRVLARKRWAAHLLVAGLIVLPFSALFLHIGGGALEAMGRNSSLTGRTDIWPLIIREAGNPLLGTGYESYWLGRRLDTIRSSYPSLNESHNGYLEIFVNLGWIGVLLMALIHVTGYRNISRLLRRSPDIGSLCMAYFIAAVVTNFTEAGFRVLSTTWLTFLLGAIVVPEPLYKALRSPSSKESSQDHASIGAAAVL